MVLSCAGEQELLATSEKLLACGLEHVRIEEPDAPFNGALMALGCKPARKEVVRRTLSSLPLLR